MCRAGLPLFMEHLLLSPSCELLAAFEAPDYYPFPLAQDKPHCLTAFESHIFVGLPYVCVCICMLYIYNFFSFRSLFTMGEGFSHKLRRVKGKLFFLPCRANDWGMMLWGLQWLLSSVVCSISRDFPLLHLVCFLELLSCNWCLLPLSLDPYHPLSLIIVSFPLPCAPAGILKILESLSDFNVWQRCIPERKQSNCHQLVLVSWWFSHSCIDIEWLLKVSYLVKDIGHVVGHAKSTMNSGLLLQF